MARRQVTVYQDDTYIVSYPKSGNTWTRFLLANLLSPNQEVDFLNIEGLVPDIYQALDLKLSQIARPRYLKSHEYFDPRYKKVVYIVRDPRAVAVSYYHHLIKMRRIEPALSMEDYVQGFLRGDWDDFGTWGENVGSWLGARRESKDFLLLRYEDLKADAQKGIAEIARFLNLSLSDEQAQLVQERSSFENMARLEKEQTKQWRPTKNSRQDMAFVRSGKAAGWREELSPELAELIYETWQEQMNELGYEK